MGSGSIVANSDSLTRILKAPPTRLDGLCIRSLTSEMVSMMSDDFPKKLSDPESSSRPDY